jgi:uncharacterized membrane protein
MKNKLTLFLTLSLSLAAIGLLCLGYWAENLLSFFNLNQAIAQYLVQNQINFSALKLGLVTLGGLLLLLTILLLLWRHKLKTKVYTLLLAFSVLLSLLAASFMALGQY